MRIGELADELGLNPKTIRFYEASGLLPQPQRTASGYRTYTDVDAERIAFIKSAQRIGMKLDEIREVLAFRDRGQAPCDYVRAVLREQAASIGERIAELTRLRDHLITLEQRSAELAQTDACYCGIIEHNQAHPLAGSDTAVATPIGAIRRSSRPTVTEDTVLASA